MEGAESAAAEKSIGSLGRHLTRAGWVGGVWEGGLAGGSLRLVGGSSQCEWSLSEEYL